MGMLNKAMGTGVFVVVATLMFVSLVLAQASQAPAAPASPAAASAPAAVARGNQPGGPGGGGRGFGMGNFDPNQMQSMMDDNSRQTMGATVEEWKVLGPRFNKVQTLSRSINGGAQGILGSFGMGGRGGMAMLGGMGGRGGMGGISSMLTAFLGEPTALDKARDNLNAALGNPSATAELQAAMRAYREAKNKAKTELATAQAELKKICTVQQEATLIAMGMLE
jgi:hypothetical protein